MPTILILILVLLVATCVIAYWSDNLGKKLGKKRISLMGLRPRQTATFISMGSSVVIMLLTLAVLLGSSASLRNALTRYDLTKKENSQLLATNKMLESDSGRLRKANDRWRTQASKARQDAISAAKLAKIEGQKAAQAQAKTLLIERNLKGVRAQLVSAQERANVASSRADAASVRASAAQSRFQSAQAQLREKVSSLREIGSRLRNIGGQLRKVQDRIKAKQDELSATQKKLLASQKTLISTRGALGKTQDAFRDINKTQKLYIDSIEELTEKKTELEAERDRLKQEYETLERQKVVLVAQIEETRLVASELATGNVEIAFGQVFADVTISPNSSNAEIIAALRSLLARGEAAAEEKLDRKLELVRKMLVGTSIQELTEEQLLDVLADGISKSDVPVSVRLAASRDHIHGENPINVRFSPIPVKTIFTKNELLGEARFGSLNTDAQVFGQLWKLLTEAQEKARDKGFSPVLTTEEPYQYAAGTNERIFEALRRIQSWGEDVEVRLYAADDVTTIDRLKIRFEVKG